MRLITVDKQAELSRLFQDNPRKTFELILDKMDLDKLTSEDVYKVLGKHLAIGDFSVTKSQFGLLVHHLNGLHDGLRQQGQGKHRVPPGLDHPEIVKNTEKYSKVVRGNHYLDAYCSGLINVVRSVAEHGDESENEFVKWCRQGIVGDRIAIFHAIFLLASALDKQDRER